MAVDVVPRYFELTGWEASFQDLEGLAVISLDGGSPGLFGRFAKRLFDVVGATLLLVVLAPVLLVVDRRGQGDLAAARCCSARTGSAATAAPSRS